MDVTSALDSFVSLWIFLPLLLVGLLGLLGTPNSNRRFSGASAALHRSPPDMPLRQAAGRPSHER